MDAVNAFNHELFSLMDTKPPISRAKMISITKSAIKAMKLYKHVVQIVEKFIKKCKAEYKVAGLYVVDSIVRQSRHQFGADKDVFGPRFTKNITGTFQNLCLCPVEDRSKIVRVLNLWQKNVVFKMEVIQPLLDMAARSSGAAAYRDMDDPDPGSPPSPEKESVVAVAAKSVAVAANSVAVQSVAEADPQLQNSDAFAAVAQLFQSSQGQQLQQMLQTFQQQPGVPQTHTQSPAHLHHFQAQGQAQTHPHLQPQNLTAGLGLAAPHLPLPTQPPHQKTALDKVATLLDRFDYDDEPEGGEDSKKETSSAQTFGQQLPVFPQHVDHFQPHVTGMTQDPSQQVSLPPNGQLQGYGLMPGQAYPGMMPPLGQAHPGQPHPGSTGPPGFLGGYPPHKEAFNQHLTKQQQDVVLDLEPPSMRGETHPPDGRRSRSGSRSPKRRRSRSNSRTRRPPRHRRSRSRDRRRHSSPRSRSQERKERERERERRQRGLPQPKNDTLSVCSTTLWVGQLDKRTQQQDVACLLEEFGHIDSINMIPPRGCAYIVMVHRQDAFRALQKLSRGTFKVNQKTIKIAWALNKGIRSEHKQYWDVELGVTYIPWAKIREDQLEGLREGGMLDVDTLSPEWRDVHNSLERPEELAQNGRSEPPVEETLVVPATAPAQVPPMRGVASLQPPGFPGPMGVPPPSFPPLPPFMRPGFNPMQMPPGFPPPGAMPLGPLPHSAGVAEDPSVDPAGLGSEGPHLYGPPGPIPSQIGTMGHQMAPPAGPSAPPPSGGLLGARPGMIPLQRPPVLPPPHMQRFPPPHAPRPPHPNMPLMPPRGPHPQIMHQEPPPPPPGRFGMPPHAMRGPFPPHRLPPGHPPPPFLRPGAPPPRGPEESEEMEGRPFRNDRPGFRERDPDRDWDRRFGGGRRPFGDGGRGGGEGGERMDNRDRFGGWQDDGGEQRGGWERERDRDRDRRDWRERGRGEEGERERSRPEGGERGRAGGEGERPKRRERSTRWDRDDRRGERGVDSESLDTLQNSHSAERPGARPPPPSPPTSTPPATEPRGDPPEDPARQQAESEPSLRPPETAADPPTKTEPTEPETTQETEA